MTVLLADEIEVLCKDKGMIVPYNSSRLRPASYQLTLGEEVHVGGEERRIDHINGFVLDPHQVAVVCTKEEISIPRDVIVGVDPTVRTTKRPS